MAKPKWKENKFKAGDDALNSDFPDYEVVAHRIGNQTNADGNNNKFFSLEIHKCSNGKYRVYSNYGRVSDDEYSGVVGVYGPGTEEEAKAFFESKFKSKVRPSKGYKEIEFITPKVGSPKSRQRKNAVNNTDIPDNKKQNLNENKKRKKQKSINLHPDVVRLVEQWYSDNTHNITSNSAVTITSDGLETPLGVLTFKQINIGRSILTDISNAIKNSDITEIRKLNSEFFSNIPSKLNRKITDEDLISTEPEIEEKTELLKQMEDALEIGGASFMSGTEQKYIDLGVDIDLLSKNDDEWKRIDHYIQTTRGHNHYGTSSKVKNVLKVKLNADHNRYEKCSINNEMELFHGSRNGNIMGIISRGLLIAPPSAPATGYMFDKAIYFSDQSTKSINYSSARFGGPKNKSNNCFLFIVKSKLGKQKELYHAEYNASRYCLNNGKFDSVKGCKGPSLIHNEYMVYTLKQAKITHIIELQN